MAWISLGNRKDFGRGDDVGRFEDGGVCCWGAITYRWMLKGQ